MRYNDFTSSNKNALCSVKTSLIWFLQSDRSLTAMNVMYLDKKNIKTCHRNDKFERVHEKMLYNGLKTCKLV